MKSISQQHTPITNDTQQGKFQLNIPTSGLSLRVQLKDAESSDKKKVRLGSYGILDWLFNRRG